MRKRITDQLDEPMFPGEPGYVTIDDILVPVDPAESDPAEYP
jgi:hypothetical protein